MRGGLGEELAGFRGYGEAMQWNDAAMRELGARSGHGECAGAERLRWEESRLTGVGGKATAA